jgi:hypothetical protein
LFCENAKAAKNDTNSSADCLKKPFGFSWSAALCALQSIWDLRILFLNYAAPAPTDETYRVTAAVTTSTTRRAPARASSASGL